MSDSNNPVFPKVRLDEMRKAATEFDLRSLPTTPWRFDGVSHLDAGESAFVARQLEFMRPGVYEIQYPALKASSLIPFNMGVDTGAEQYTVTSIDQVGEVKVSRDQAGNTPMIEVLTSQASAPIFSLRLGYEYSLQEARAAIFARVPLIPRKAMGVREQMERKLDDIAFVGEGVTAVKGLLNQSGTDTYTVPSTGAGGLKTWDSKASDDVLLDMNGMVTQVVTNTKEVEIPDTMILPLSSRNLIASRRVGDGTSTTILAYFQQNTPFIKTVETTFKAESNSGWTGKRAVAYRKDPTRLEMVVPQPFEQLPPTANGFMVTTLCHMRTLGVALYLPKSVIYADGI